MFKNLPKQNNSMRNTNIRFGIKITYKEIKNLGRSYPLRIYGKFPAPLVEDKLHKVIGGIKPGKSYNATIIISTEDENEPVEPWVAPEKEHMINAKLFTLSNEDANEFFPDIKMYSPKKVYPLILSSSGFLYLPGLFARNEIITETKRLLLRWADWGLGIKIFVPE